MENDRIIREQLADFFKTFIIKIRFSTIFISAMACADSDSE